MTDFADVFAHLEYKDLIIQELLGRGKFGKVRKAHCEKLNRVVAVKIISDSKAFKKEEIEILVKSTAHDNVISIKDVIKPVKDVIKPVNEDEDKYWIVMEFCDYNVQQIRDKLPNNRIPWARWVTVMKDILAGLIYLHEKKFVHCDLKPENVLVNDRFEAKIADVGLSRIAGEPYITSENDDIVLPSGTLQYISPERLRDPRKAPAFADDYYSCGLLFYKMITNGDLFYLKGIGDEETKISSIKYYVCETQYRHSLEELVSKFQTPPEITTAIGILWDKIHTNRIADKAQKVIKKAIIKHGYDQKKTLEEADKYLKDLMDGNVSESDEKDSGEAGNVPSNPQPELDEVDSVGIEGFFDDIAKLDGISNWKQFARQGLRLKNGDLQEIEEEHKKFQDQKVAMLMKWLDINGLKATVDQLEKALLKCKFKLAAQKLRKIEGLPK